MESPPAQHFHNNRMTADELEKILSYRPESANVFRIQERLATGGGADKTDVEGLLAARVEIPTNQAVLATIIGQDVG